MKRVVFVEVYPDDVAVPAYTIHEVVLLEIEKSEAGVLREGIVAHVSSVLVPSDRCYGC